MKLYNALTRSVQDFQPLSNNTARVYTCGPTVYDHAHIGNLSSYIFADTLRRTLLQAGYRTKQVMNYTDVDDKTIRRSRERYPNKPPMEALHLLTDQYIDLFLEDIKKVGVDVAAITFLRATDKIEAMQHLIADLYEQGFAYIADDGVYFSIEAYRKSGKTYGQLLDITSSNTSEARIQNDEYDKESVHDFALWKLQKDDEPAWEFVLDSHQLPGRPGWHIECSAMSREGLGQPFDIHTGGVDLIFPHHENEIAQSTAGQTNPVMATFFTHNDHILVDGKKMAKSAQNFYTLADIIKRSYDPLAFRVMVLQGHYRNQVNFTWESITAAQNRLADFRQLADLQFQPIGVTPWLADDQALLDIEKHMQNDLDTPMALMELSKFSSLASERLISSDDVALFKKLLGQLDLLFGLQLGQRQDITDAQKQLISDRQAAREQQDWTTADSLRDALLAEGIILRDTPQGAVWYRAG
jgi:cysteinyl-tRNA synthetase